jgi:fructokinase
MGAGDATLAAIIDWVLRFGVPQGAETWRASIHRAMDIAGATCQKRGGTLVVPEEQLSIGLVPGATY